AGEERPARLTQEANPDTVTHIATTTEGRYGGPPPTPGRNTTWDSSEPTPAPRHPSPASSSATSTPPPTKSSTRPSPTLCSSRTSAANAITSRPPTTSSHSSAGRKSAPQPRPWASRSQETTSEPEPAAKCRGRSARPRSGQGRHARRGGSRVRKGPK